jgi:hypothetical protein
MFALTLRLVVDGEDFALGVGSMGSIGALEVHFLGGLFGLRGSGINLGWPELLPRLSLLFGLRRRHDCWFGLNY